MLSYQKYIIQFIEPYQINWTDKHGSILYLDYLAGDLSAADIEDGEAHNTSDLYLAGGIDLFNVPKHIFKILKIEHIVNFDLLMKDDI